MRGSRASRRIARLSSSSTSVAPIALAPSFSFFATWFASMRVWKTGKPLRWLRPRSYACVNTPVTWREEKGRGTGVRARARANETVRKRARARASSLFSHLDLVAPARDVNQVGEQDDVLVPRHAPGRHRAGRLLDRALLVVAVHRRLGVELERARARRAARAALRLDLGARALPERPEPRAALAAVVRDEQLWEDARAARDNPAHAHELPEVRVAQVAQLVEDRQRTHAHVHLRERPGRGGTGTDHDGARGVARTCARARASSPRKICL